MRSIHTRIFIEASPAHVWAALMASGAIPPEIRDAIRELRIGQPLKVKMSSGGRSVSLTIKLLTAEPPYKIRWKGHLLIPGLFDGEHSVEISENSQRSSLLHQYENFSGILVPFLSRTIEQTKQRFEETNAKVRDLAEKGYA